MNSSARPALDYTRLFGFAANGSRSTAKAGEKVDPSALRALDYTRLFGFAANGRRSTSKADDKVEASRVIQGAKVGTSKVGGSKVGD